MKKNENNQRKFVIKTAAISTVLLIVVTAFTVVSVKTWPMRTLKKIDRFIEGEEYLLAENLIEKYEYKVIGADMESEKLLCSYSIAVELVEQGNTEDALYRLKQMQNYKNSLELIKECNYIDAVNTAEKGEYDKAYTLFLNLLEYKDSIQRAKECRYNIAEEAFGSGDAATAFEIYVELDGYKNSNDKADKAAMEITGADTSAEAYSIIDGMNIKELEKIEKLGTLRGELPEKVLAVGAHHTVGLKSDGTVIAAGSNEKGQCDVSYWDNIVAIDAGYYHTIALTKDGRVLASGSNEYGQCEVSQFENVVQIAAGAYTTYVLLEDGTIESAGFSNEGVFSEIKNAKKIFAGSYAAACVTEDGRMVVSHMSLSLSEKWAVSAAIGTGWIAVLMPDGSVLSCDDLLDEWQDILTISGGSNVILGIKSDGSLNAYFFDKRDCLPLDEYKNVLAAAAGGSHSAILLADGSVAAFGNNEYGECDTKTWNLFDGN